jgi:hypothetical protein
MAIIEVKRMINQKIVQDKYHIEGKSTTSHNHESKSKRNHLASAQRYY